MFLYLFSKEKDNQVVKQRGTTWICFFEALLHWKCGIADGWRPWSRVGPARHWRWQMLTDPWCIFGALLSAVPLREAKKWHLSVDLRSQMHRPGPLVSFCATCNALQRQGMTGHNLPDPQPELWTHVKQSHAPWSHLVTMDSFSFGCIWTWVVWEA